MVEQQDALSRTYAAIADPSRRAILAHLRKGPARVTDIARNFPISLNAVSKHIRSLEQAGLVCRRVEWREHYISLAPGRLKQATRWLDRYRSFWEARFDALETHLKRRRRQAAPGRKSR